MQIGIQRILNVLILKGTAVIFCSENSRYLNNAENMQTEKIKCAVGNI